MQTILLGFQYVFSDPMCIALLALGVFVGIIFGSIPGLTATLGVTLFIPFTYTMQPVQGLVMLIAVYVGGISGGLITATLINIPGTPSSIYTCFDGYPMTKKGKPAQALAIGVFCSLIGGSFSAFALMAIAPQLAKVSLSFGSWEYFAVGRRCHVLRLADQGPARRSVRPAHRHGRHRLHQRRFPPDLRLLAASGRHLLYRSDDGPVRHHRGFQPVS